MIVLKLTNFNNRLFYFDPLKILLIKKIKKINF